MITAALRRWRAWRQGYGDGVTPGMHAQLQAEAAAASSLLRSLFREDFGSFSTIEAAEKCMDEMCGLPLAENVHKILDATMDVERFWAHVSR